MNYVNIYEKIINRAMLQNRVKNPHDGFDRHHILPKSLGGTDDHNNIVLLTAKEHYLAHKLLVRIHTGDNKKKMIYALWWMSKTKMISGNKTRISSRDYEHARKLFIEANVNNDVIRKEKWKKNRDAGIYKYDNVKAGRALSEALNKLSPEEKRQRMINSTMTADHESRCRAIRRGKASIIQITNLDNSTEIIFSDQVQSILDLTWPQIKYRLKAHNGLLLDGRRVTILKKYTGGNKWKNK